MMLQVGYAMQGQRVLKFATLGAVESVRCKILGTVCSLHAYVNRCQGAATQRCCSACGVAWFAQHASTYCLGHAMWAALKCRIELCVQVRQLSDSTGETEEAGPSIAVQMIGLNAVPVAGDEFVVCETEQEVPLRPSQQLPHTDFGSNGVKGVLRCHV